MALNKKMHTFLKKLNCEKYILLFILYICISRAVYLRTTCYIIYAKVNILSILLNK